MAAYAATVTSPMKDAERISRSLGIYSGTVNISNYNAALVEITGITRYFKTGTGTIVSVVANGPTANGYDLAWNYASGAFKAFAPTNIVFSGSATGANVTWSSALNAFQAVSAEGTHIAEGIESADDTDLGAVSFVAIGFI
jgi:hypothetical protein